MPQFREFYIEAATSPEKVIEQLVKPGTTVYRGIRIGPESRTQTLRQLLSADYFGRRRTYDHWSINRVAAERFAAGTHLNPDGTLGNGNETSNILIAAKINPEDVDMQEFKRVLSGQQYKHLDGNSYFDPTNKDENAEQEIPVLRSSYPRIELVAYWVMDKATKRFMQGHNMRKLA